MPTTPTPDELAALGNAPTPPTVVELEQDPVPGLAIPVAPMGPTTVHVLPAKAGAWFTFDVQPDIPSQMVLGPDPSRAAVTLVGSADFGVARKASDRAGAYVPASTPIRLQSAEAIYLVAPGAAQAVAVGVFVETWAD
jgi:hypothetical protein